MSATTREGRRITSQATATLSFILAIIATTVIKASSENNLERDYAPKLIHQPQSAHVQPNKPHTIECAVESKPEAEVKWFKDDQLLASQPTHLEQTGSELMFFQMNEEDTGEYHCQATNYLGSISSERFRLTVHSSIHDPRIQLEPRLTEVGTDQLVEFTCTIPTEDIATDNQRQRTKAQPEVSWTRNGRKLLVGWLDQGEDLADTRGTRFVSRQVSSGRYSLTILRTQLLDDNSTFTCSYKTQQSDLNYSEQETTTEVDSESTSLVRESSPILLRVYDLASNRNRGIYPIPDINLAPPIEGIEKSKPPTISNSEDDRTTKLDIPQGDLDRSKSIQEIIRALFELARPTLAMVVVLALVALVVGLQLVYIRRRSRENRYMKHQYAASGASTGGSGTSSTSGGPLDCDSVLSTLLGRTLSAPSCAAAVSLAGGSKKYRSYRDHMRKVAAVNNDSADLVDSYLALAGQSNHLVGHHQQSEQLQASYFPNQVHLPNLYNQSLAARNQARSLLQASEHMRSLSNLSNQNNKLHNNQTNRIGQHNGSHLNLALSYTSNNAIRVGGPNDGAIWPPPSQQSVATANRTRQHYDEHYQLVNCSDSVSPSTSTSIAGSNSTSSSSQLRRSSSELTNRTTEIQQRQQTGKDSVSNHYSTIETHDEDDRAYEEIDPHQQSHNSRTSSFLSNRDEQTKKTHVRQTPTSGSDSTAARSISQKFVIDHSSLLNSSTRSKRDPTMTTTSSSRQQQSYSDQPSPYAVSSICNSISPQVQTQAQAKPQSVFPPMTSEAMRDLKEQFDIEKLMLIDEVFRSNLHPPPRSPP